jgi:hypothetical protein
MGKLVTGPAVAAAAYLSIQTTSVTVVVAVAIQLPVPKEAVPAVDLVAQLTVADYWCRFLEGQVAGAVRRVLTVP